MKGSLVVVDDVAKAFAQLVVDQAQSNSLAFSLAFSGGSTARDCYRELARSGSTAIDWKNVTGWWGDERCVPLTDLASNFRLVKDSLLEFVEPSDQTVTPHRSSLVPMRSILQRIGLWF